MLAGALGGSGLQAARESSSGNSRAGVMRAFSRPMRRGEVAARGSQPKCALLPPATAADRSQPLPKSEKQVPTPRGAPRLNAASVMVAATEAAPQPVIGHLEHPQAMAQQLQLTPPQRKGTDPAAAPAQPPTSPVAATAWT